MSTPFPLPMIFTAWGFRKSADAWNGAQFLADRCKAEKIKTVAVQLGTDYSPDGIPNCTREEADILRENGLRVAVWGVTETTKAQAELLRLGATQADWMPQIEADSQGALVLDAISKG